MGSKNRGKAKRSNRQTTKQTTEIPTTNFSPAGIPSMFSNAQHFQITGGSFNIMHNVNSGNGSPLDVLYRRVAPNAILNTGGRADDVRCHPGTREEIISRIEKWGHDKDGLMAPMFWLSGPAGAGKSAIVQTLAERCDQRGVPHANFFFFRADNSRSHASPLIATLLHQIILLYPYLQDQLANVISTNPLVFDSVLENQVAQLIVTPLRSIQLLSPTYRPLLLLVDGLDECDSETKRSQLQVLHAFDKALTAQPCPFRMLVASRDESQIRAAFNRLSTKCLPLYLDDRYSPGKDIRVFVDAQFQLIRQTHPLAHTLDPTWPSAVDVDYIVEKSSGQFIYAATVMRFISDSSASPLISLERVKGAARLASKSPFSHLDAIYTYILAQVDDQEALKDVLHAQILIKSVRPIPPSIPLLDSLDKTSVAGLLALFNPNYTKAIFLSCLADLTPIAKSDTSGNKLLFLHASFPDYLLDQSRSGDYFVNVAAFSDKILPVVWKFIADRPRTGNRWIQLSLVSTSRLQKLPPGLMNTMASTMGVWSVFGPQDSVFFQTIYKLCTCDEDVESFRGIIRQWIHSHPVTEFQFKDGIEDIPFCRRYYWMARAETLSSPDREMMDALSPQSDFDYRELAMWLNDLLHSIHREVYTYDPKRYKQLLRDWLSWAVLCHIPCDGIEHLPYTEQYILSVIKQK